MNARATPKLLVSVRSAAEAHAALAGGADLIDVKEPAHGPLGAARHAVIHEVIAAVGQWVPVSAALGEWTDWREQIVPAGLQYAKWGLAQLARLSTHILQAIRHSDCARYPVLVAYADHLRASSPDPEWLAAAAVRYRFPAFLLDTAVKDGSTLTDWVAPATLARVRSALGDAGVAVALAGSIDDHAVRRLAPLEPDWFAVRGAACDGGRLGAVSADRVRHLRAVIGDASRATAG